MAEPVAPSVIINDPNAVPDNLDTNGGEDNVIANDDVMVDRTLQSVATAPNQVSDYLAAYLVYGANLMGYEKVERVKPGMLKLKEPDTIIGIFEKWETIYEYSEKIVWYSPIVYQFMLLCWCTIFGLSQGEKTEYCYDNVFADILLEGGDEPDGIYGYVDMFTWDGFLEVYGISIANKIFTEFMVNSVVSIFLAGVFYKFNESGIPLCTEGEQALILAGKYDLCLYASFI